MAEAAGSSRLEVTVPAGSENFGISYDGFGIPNTDFGFEVTDILEISFDWFRLAATVQVYSVDSLFGDLSTGKRRAYMACYLYQRLSALIDLAVEAFAACRLSNSISKASGCVDRCALDLSRVYRRVEPSSLRSAKVQGLDRTRTVME